MITPAGQQIECLEKVFTWDANPTKAFYTIGGYAGTGKTSLIPHIRNGLHPNSALVTYANRAAGILREKGEGDATTIFKLMYKLIDEERMIWRRNDNLEVDLVIVDEASMVGQKIRDDLESYGIPVLYIGDPFQLPPIKEESVMDYCDFTLTEVRRHGDKILEIATAIREGRKYPDIDQYSLSDSDLCDADMVICLSNERRNRLNQKIRGHKGFNGDIKNGERVVMRKTDYDCGIFAGDMGTLIGTNHSRRYEVLFDGADDTTVFTNGYFLKPGENPYALEFKGRGCLDFGYACTAHTAQGSQWDKVIYWEEAHADARHKYTGATRAVKELTMAGR